VIGSYVEIESHNGRCERDFYAPQSLEAVSSPNSPLFPHAFFRCAFPFDTPLISFQLWCTEAAVELIQSENVLQAQTLRRYQKIQYRIFFETLRLVSVVSETQCSTQSQTGRSASTCACYPTSHEQRTEPIASSKPPPTSSAEAAPSRIQKIINSSK